MLNLRRDNVCNPYMQWDMLEDQWLLLLVTGKVFSASLLAPSCSVGLSFFTIRKDYSHAIRLGLVRLAIPGDLGVGVEPFF